MNEDEIFEKSKKLMKKSGKLVYCKNGVAGHSDGLFEGQWIHEEKYKLTKGKLKIEYYHASELGEVEELAISEKIFPFLPRILRYYSIRMTDSQIAEITRKTIGGDWEGQLEQILFNSA